MLLRSENGTQYVRISTTNPFLWIFLLLASVSSAQEPYDAIYENDVLEIPKIYVPAPYDGVFRVQMVLDQSEAAARTGCLDYCFRVTALEAESIISPPNFPDFDGQFANINRLWADGTLYNVQLEFHAEVGEAIYFRLFSADTPQPFEPEPLVLPDSLAKEYYDYACSQYSTAAPNPSIQFVIPVDLNDDEYTDFIVVYWCDLDADLWGSFQRDPTPDVLVAFISDDDGNYRIDNEAVFGSKFPALGGASRKYVRGDFNGNGHDDFAFSMNWEDGRRGAGHREAMSQAAYPALLLSQGFGKYEVVTAGEKSWGHAVDFVENRAGGLDAVFAGFVGKHLQAFRYLDGKIVDVTSEYPANARNQQWATSFRGLPLGNRDDNTRYVVASHGDGLALWRENEFGWGVSSTYSVPVEFEVNGITWQQTPMRMPVQNLDGKQYAMGAFDELCVMHDFDSSEDIIIIAKFSAVKFVDTVDRNKVYEQNELAPAQSMVFFKTDNGNLIRMDSPLAGEIEEHNSNFYNCSDVNDNGYSDLVVSVLSTSWLGDDYDFGGNPLIYLNDRNGNLVRIGTESYPTFDSGHSQGFLHDVNSNGLFDLVLFQQNIQQYLAPGVSNDILIYRAKEMIGN